MVFPDPTISTIYADEMASEEELRLRAENQRYRLENQRQSDRIAVLEGMYESLAVGIGGSLSATLEWVRGTRLTVFEGEGDESSVGAE